MRIKHVLFTCLFWQLTSTISATELTGVVVNHEREPLAGVTIRSNIEGHFTKTHSDGAYRIDTETAEGHTVSFFIFSSVGYLTRHIPVASMPDTVILRSIYLEIGDILITSERAQSGFTPVAHENITTQEIERQYTMGDPPLLLNSATNVYTFSDGGGNLGYTYMTIRGFDDKRLATYLNGVPLNDPEDQYSYWADLPDFLSSVTDIQVQRGVGNSLYGDASFGGSVNVVSTILNRPRELRLSAGYGNFLLDDVRADNSYLSSIAYNSGLIDGQWSLGARFSKSRSDGYREQSWVDSWAYYLAAARVGERSITEFQTFGGPMSLHLSFYGVPRDVLSSNRRLNPLTYRYETDNFNQPHYHLHHRLALSEQTTLLNTWYYVRGNGYFEQYVAGANYSDYNIDSSQADTTSGDLVRQQHVSKYQLGWNPRLDVDHNRGSHSMGGSLYYFSSDHWGEVIWAQRLVGTLQPRHRYYVYGGKKWVGSAFVEEHYQLTDRMNSQVTAQLRYQHYDFSQDRIGAFKGYPYSASWLAFSPRAGLNYLLVDGEDQKTNVYANFAVASRTPTDAAIYDATDPHALPSLKVENRNIIGPDTIYTFGEPTVDAERVYDVELGLRHQRKRAQGGVNLYWMDLQNEIIPYGGINPSTGQLATLNAEGSLRMGVELDGSIELSSWLNLSGNLSFNHSRVDSASQLITIYDSVFNVVGSTTLVSTDTKAPLLPEILGSLTTTVETGNWRLGWQIRYIGKQFVDLRNTDSLAIPEGFVSSLDAAVTMPNLAGLGELTIRAVVNNLFDRKYESSGYGYSYAVSDGTSLNYTHAGEYYPAAERNIFIQAVMRIF